MHFTSAIATAILAFTSAVSAAPGHINSRQENNAPATQAVELTQVQQLLLAPTAVDRFKILSKPGDFVKNLTPPPTDDNKGGAVNLASRGTFPALVGSGAAMAVGRIEGCGINTFHVHPRSAELQMVLNGTIITEMVPENNVKVIRNELKEFDMTVFYQGSVHHQFNPNCDPAYFVAAFANEDPGTNQVENGVYQMDERAIFHVLGEEVDLDTIKDIKKNIPASFVQGLITCRQQCANQRFPGSRRPGRFGRPFNGGNQANNQLQGENNNNNNNGQQ